MQEARCGQEVRDMRQTQILKIARRPREEPILAPVPVVPLADTAAAAALLATIDVVLADSADALDS